LTVVRATIALCDLCTILLVQRHTSLDLEVMIRDIIRDSNTGTGGGFEDFDFRDMGLGDEWHLINVIEPGQGEGFGDSWGAVGRP
jgi:hypothetical protein